MALVSVLFIGCSPAPSVATPSGAPPTGGLGISANPSKDEITDPNVSWISPAKVEVGNLYPNATGEFELTIYNGRDTNAAYSVEAQVPSFVADGYTAIPKEYLTWVTFDNPRPVVPPKQSRIIIVDITMPASVTYSQKKAEVWVVVRDETQAGSIQTQLACRVMVDTR
jgi:hypothetical protein